MGSFRLVNLMSLFVQAHAETVVAERRQFEDRTQFQLWLRMLSDKRHEQFVKKEEIYNKDGVLTMKHVCRASREAASVSNRQERLVRAAESSKMEMNCLALIRSIYPKGLSGEHFIIMVSFVPFRCNQF